MRRTLARRCRARPPSRPAALWGSTRSRSGTTAWSSSSCRGVTLFEHAGRRRSGGASYTRRTGRCAACRTTVNLALVRANGVEEVCLGALLGAGVCPSPAGPRAHAVHTSIAVSRPRKACGPPRHQRPSRAGSASRARRPRRAPRWRRSAPRSRVSDCSRLVTLVVSPTVAKAMLRRVPMSPATTGRSAGRSPCACARPAPDRSAFHAFSAASIPRARPARPWRPADRGPGHRTWRAGRRR